MNRMIYTVTGESASVIFEGRTYTVKRTAPNFVELRKALIEERWEDAAAHLRVDSSLERWAKGRFTVLGNNVLFDGEVVPSDINARISEMASAGEDPTPLFNFWERLNRNPSARSVEQLWRFLNLTGIPLTSDGCFLAYKGVRPDFKDCRSGTISNHVGALVKVPRNKVSDDPHTACHFGLHVGSLEYASGFGQRVVICKVDPEHVVSVPHDCTSQKMRVCEYTVIGQHGEGHMPSTTIRDEDWYAGVDDSFEDNDPSDPDYSNDDEIGQIIAQGLADHIAAIQDAEFVSDVKIASAVQEHERLFHGTSPLVEQPVEVKTFFLNETHELPAIPKKGRLSKAASWIRHLDALDEANLYSENMDTLRAYASRGLRIVGASHIPGGKSALIAAIIKARS